MIYFQIWFIVVVYLPTPTTGQNPHGFSKFDTRSDICRMRSRLSCIRKFSSTTSHSLVHVTFFKNSVGAISFAAVSIIRRDVCAIIR